MAVEVVELVAMEPLLAAKGIAFDKGELRFSVDISGAAHLLRGTVEGEAITGSIQKGGQSASGTFTIKFVE